MGLLGSRLLQLPAEYMLIIQSPGPLPALPWSPPGLPQQSSGYLQGHNESILQVGQCLTQYLTLCPPHNNHSTNIKQLFQTYLTLCKLPPPVMDAVMHCPGFLRYRVSTLPAAGSAASRWLLSYWPLPGVTCAEVNCPDQSPAPFSGQPAFNDWSTWGFRLRMTL